MKLSFIVCCFLLVLNVAQAQFKNTLKYTNSTISPKATLQDISWINGYWKGEAFGGIIEEIWSKPLGNSMMGSFKLVNDNKVSFYELCTITTKNNTLLLQLKHFNSDLTGWEEKDKTVDFKLVKITPKKVYFDGFTFEYISPNEINLYVIIPHKNGKEEEMIFNYHKE
ncbi:DUF6265 family protein [Zhouia sp. PK063]|uniref:DUF6265 family protein n=1 Tax=Zhouia sp. PK063 TaxID=3373602 RepID=UPI0037B48540